MRITKPKSTFQPGVDQRRVLPDIGVILRGVLFLSILLAPAAYGSGSVSCSNGSSDATLIQSAVNGGGTVTLTGTCSLKGVTINLNNPVVINGPATLNGSQSQIFALNSNNVTINGLTINYGYLFGGNAQYYSNFIFTNNVMQHLYYAGTSGGVSLINIGGLQYSSISNNTFSSWGGGADFGNATPSTDDSWGNPVLLLNSMNQTSISNNVITSAGQDAFHITFMNSTGTVNAYPTFGNVIAYNTFTHVRRIPIEIQSQPSGGCWGGSCNYSVQNTTGLQVKGNYIHNYAPYVFWNTWGASLVPDGALGSQWINNTFIADPATSASFAPCIESGSRTGLVQGNVCAGVPNTPGFTAAVWQGGNSNPSYTISYQNNVFCGTSGNTVVTYENSPTTSSKLVDQYNYKNSTACPAGSNPATSSLNAAFVGNPAVSGSNQTWNLSVTSNLSIRYVQFFLDGAATPVTTQEISDVNTNFATDRKWLYHLTLSTASLGSGSHSVTARVTDASGATQSVTQGTPAVVAGSPTVSLSPASLAFGSQAIGLSANQIITLTNTGTASLTVNGISITGANSASFGSSSTCGSSLSVGSSCSITISFSPSSIGTYSASLVVTDNAAGSPHSESLSGTGTSQLLPTNLPQGMILWLTPDVGVVSSSAKAVSQWNDQSGQGHNAVQTSSASQPSVVPGNNGKQAIHFDGASDFMSSTVPIVGATGVTIFAVSASSDDPSAAYGSNSLLNWPENAWWGDSFFATYQSYSEFRFGTTQVGNENHTPMAFNRTNSFGLNEWEHDGTTDYMFLNGQTVIAIPGKSSTLAGIGNTMIIGADQTQSSFFSGDVSEIIIYNRALSVTERQAVEQYLMTKYHL